MSTLEVNKITPVSGGTTVQVGESGDTINIPAGATIANAGTSTGFGDSLRPNVNPLIINGDMAVAQRNTSVTGITDDGYKLCDRWYEYLSSLGTYTFAQEAQTSGNAFDNGFRTAFRIDCTTADASPSASDEFWWGMKFEGQDLQLIKKGTSNAQKLTLAFWVKSNKTGVGQVNFRDTDNSRMCSGTYTISVANTWEHKIINIAADTTGSFNNDNAESLQIQWYLDSGSNYEGGTAPTAWEADSATDRNASGTLNIGDNTANDWSITGVQLEVGEYTSSTLPPFQHESFGDNKQRCMRYYQNSYKSGNALTSTTGNNAIIVTSWNDGNCPFPNMFPVPMRDEPTVTLRPRGSTTTGQISSNGTDRSATATDVSEKGVSYLTVTSGTALTYSGFTFELETEL